MCAGFLTWPSHAAGGVAVTAAHSDHRWLFALVTDIAEQPISEVQVVFCEPLQGQLAEGDFVIPVALQRLLQGPLQL